MRIGVDMMAVQSPHHGHRGIGRYSANLVTTLLDRSDGHEYVLYAHEGLSTHRIPQHPRAVTRTLSPRADTGESVSSRVDRLARENPDSLDVLLILSPFEHWALYTPPARPPGGLKIVGLVHDLIPFLFPNEWVVDPVLMRHYRVLEELKRYDALVSNSEATRQDCLSVLGLDPDRIVTISGASKGSFFSPDPAGAQVADEATQRRLQSLGISRPFVFNVGGLDERKNTWTLIDAFAALPERLRNSHQLVLTFEINDWDRGHVLEHAARVGLEGAVVVTGEISDEDLRLLYRRCEAFVFPSRYEGFGLPILEAMQCGAAVLAGNNSSQIEVVGDGGLLTETSEATGIAAKLARLLEDEALRRELRPRALKQAARFRWERTAEVALEVLTGLHAEPPPRRPRLNRGRSRKPTIAFFSPLPPRKSGISDYSAFLLEELRKTYTIDLFHDAGYVPEPALASPDLMACDYRLFDRIEASKGYHAIVYQMGNSRYHSYMYDVMLRHPGLTTLHDFCLAGFHLHYGHSIGQGLAFIREELERGYPEDAECIRDVVDGWPNDWELIARDCVRRGWFLNRRVLDSALRMVVHSPWCREQVRLNSPWQLDKVEVIPHGIHPRRETPAERAAIRQRFDLPRQTLIVASFGFVHPDKMSPQALDAFAEATRTNPDALFLFVGEEADGGQVRRHAEALGLNERVRFLGRQPARAFTDLMAVTDVGVNLRMPPTNGETSGALLNLLASGVPTIVTDVATFSDYPSDVVRKVRWETEGARGLLRAVGTLLDDPDARTALSRAAWEFVEDHNDWPKVAKLYVEAIELCHEQGRRASRSRAGTAEVQVV